MSDYTSVNIRIEEEIFNYISSLKNRENILSNHVLNRRKINPVIIGASRALFKGNYERKDISDQNMKKIININDLKDKNELEFIIKTIALYDNINKNIEEPETILDNLSACMNVVNEIFSAAWDENPEPTIKDIMLMQNPNNKLLEEIYGKHDM